MKAISVLLMATFGVLVILAVNELPPRGEPQAPASRSVSAAGSPVAATYYILNALKDADTPNMVTVVLADYRGYDTLGELTVIFCAGLAVLLLLRIPKNASSVR
ncbi:MAG: hypothetical protein FJ279_05460 [Planctomycetes bacterium]|nr:hypothetical protein [Planctomycetota bacterium]MBM4083227.1 hypothetical protein [Planctomycetota bacterium]